jgi:purine-nucleoside phosphorylase
MSLFDQVEEARRFVEKKIRIRPEIAVVLGSGLGFLEQKLAEAVEIPYADVPNMLPSSVPGHSGKLMAGRLQGKPVLLLSGRVHLYEGHSVGQVTFPLRVAIALGVRSVILTNAAGGLSPNWRPGDVMLISDHINLQGENALVGPLEPRFGERFVDMTDAYDVDLRARMKRWAAARGFKLRQGVYLGLLGPSYETKAEIRMYRTFGADAVGMSTVQEAIVARQMGAKVLGFSVITNLAAGVSAGPLSHEEVKQTAEAVKETFAALVLGAVSLL